ncbi:hypothetical protein RHMOL_Rhmol02G0114700 [Rhododendron molle]|uniref:Uncharacterized protein n=1 Tax=Rhododendron molle TaxID=49168 RepID=A0ACC0PNP8_RHOML|nr:hypothetical protein RHMOL_Rhmol02G0114700 [Rhododendron molle]
MENREKKILTGFCYWGGERKVNGNGTFLYNGGVCVAILLEEGNQVNELFDKVCGALNINREGKMFFYNTKRDKTKYVTLKDDNCVAMLFHLNEDDVDLFVEDIGQNSDPIRNTAYNSTRLGGMFHFHVQLLFIFVHLNNHIYFILLGNRWSLTIVAHLEDYCH